MTRKLIHRAKVLNVSLACTISLQITLNNSHHHFRPHQQGLETHSSFLWLSVSLRAYLPQYDCWLFIVTLMSCHPQTCGRIIYLLKKLLKVLVSVFASGSSNQQYFQLHLTNQSSHWTCWLSSTHCHSDCLLGPLSKHQFSSSCHVVVIQSHLYSLRLIIISHLEGVSYPGTLLILTSVSEG